jgi:transposase-like protein
VSYVSAYDRVCLSFRDVQDLLVAQGTIVLYETIRHRFQKFGPGYSWKLKRRNDCLGDHRHLDEAFIRINGQPQYLWRAETKTPTSLISWSTVS